MDVFVVVVVVLDDEDKLAQSVSSMNLGGGGEVRVQENRKRMPFHNPEDAIEMNRMRVRSSV